MNMGARTSVMWTSTVRPKLTSRTKARTEAACTTRIREIRWLGDESRSRAAFLWRVRHVQDFPDGRWRSTAPQGEDDSGRHQRHREQECRRAGANVHAHRDDGRGDNGNGGEPES